MAEIALCGNIAFFGHGPGGGPMGGRGPGGPMGPMGGGPIWASSSLRTHTGATAGHRRIPKTKKVSSSALASFSPISSTKRNCLRLARLGAFSYLRYNVKMNSKLKQRTIKTRKHLELFYA